MVSKDYHISKDLETFIRIIRRLGRDLDRLVQVVRVDSLHNLIFINPIYRAGQLDYGLPEKWPCDTGLHGLRE